MSLMMPNFRPSRSSKVEQGILIVRRKSIARVKEIVPSNELVVSDYCYCTN